MAKKKFQFVNDYSRSINLSPKKKFTFVNDSSRSTNLSAKKTVSIKNSPIINHTIGSTNLSANKVAIHNPSHMRYEKMRQTTTGDSNKGNPCHDEEGKFC